MCFSLSLFFTVWAWQNFKDTFGRPGPYQLPISLDSFYCALARTWKQSRKKSHFTQMMQSDKIEVKSQTNWSVVYCPWDFNSSKQ